MIQIDLSDHRPLYEQIKDKIKELKPAFEGNVKQACFLGVSKDELIRTVNEIYKEQEMTADD